MRRLAGGLLLLVLFVACTPREERLWRRWHRTDPVAAVEYLYDSGLVDRPDRAAGSDTAGIYEPWISLAECESNGQWSISTGNGYYGGLQFSLRSWRWVGGDGYPNEASPSEQVARAERLLDLQGWGAWPTCSRILGLR